LLAADCNDADIAINPIAEEICENGIDDNCNGNIDENCCGIPISLSAINITGISATLNWGAVSGANKYQIQYRLAGTTSWISSIRNSPVVSLNIFGLTAVSTYEWRIRAQCGSIWSEYSSIQNFTTICQIPLNLTVVAISANQATFQWSSVPGTVKYQLQYRALGATTWTSTIVYSPTISKTILTLSPETTYQCRVRAQCGTAWSDYTAIANFATTVVCESPTILTTTNITASNARLNWDAAVEATNYQVRFRQVGTSSWTSQFTSALYKPISALLAATNYEWQVRAKCGTSYGPYTSPTLFTTLGLTPRLNDQSSTPWAFTIHPNPSNGRFTVTPLARIEGVANVTLFDVAGRIVLNQTWNASEDATLVLDKNLDNGMYMLSIIAADGQVFKSGVVIANY